MRKFIPITAVIVAVIAAYIFFIRDLSDKRPALKESFESKYATLAKYEAFIKNSRTAETELGNAVKDVEGIEADIMHGNNESLAFAKLQGYVHDYAEKSGIKIISIRPMSVVKYKYYLGLPIQIEAGGSISQLGEFMRQIDTGKQLINIDRLNINVTNMQMPIDLRIRMQVSGLMQVSARNEKA